MGDDERIGMVAARMLLLGYQPQETPEQYALLIDNWITALRGIPVEHIEEAAVELLRTWVANVRPGPGSLRLIADRIWARAERHRPKELPPPPGLSVKLLDWPREDRAAKVAAIIACAFPAADSTPEWCRPGAPREPHWTEGLPSDHRRVKELMAARDENPIVRAAREEAARESVDA